MGRGQGGEMHGCIQEMRGRRGEGSTRLRGSPRRVGRGDEHVRVDVGPGGGLAHCASTRYREAINQSKSRKVHYLMLAMRTVIVIIVRCLEVSGMGIVRYGCACIRGPSPRTRDASYPPLALEPLPHPQHVANTATRLCPPCLSEHSSPPSSPPLPAPPPGDLSVGALEASSAGGALAGRRLRPSQSHATPLSTTRIRAPSFTTAGPVGCEARGLDLARGIGMLCVEGGEEEEGRGGLCAMGPAGGARWCGQAAAERRRRTGRGCQEAGVHARCASRREAKVAQARRAFRDKAGCSGKAVGGITREDLG